MKYQIKVTSQFKKDIKSAEKRNLRMNLLKEIIEKLANGEQLPAKNKDHELSNNWKGFRECHIQPDWLLIYKIDNNILVLTLVATGTHSDLFN